jgi:glucokinase
VKYYLGVDVGGTKIAAGVVGDTGDVLSQVRRTTAQVRADGDPRRGIIALGREALKLAGEGRATAVSLSGVGIALPGPVAREGIRMLAAPTIPEIQDMPLHSALTAAFGAPASGDNDANGCALAEARFGAGRGFGHVVYFTVSTGIGGGIVKQGQVQRGSRGTSAEFGHQIVVPSGGPRCDCGSEGCLEALASGTGLAVRARRRQWPGDQEATAEQLAEWARSGDRHAKALWDETALYLSIGIGNVINILDPEAVVLGGGVITGAADLLLDPVRELIRRRCMPSLARQVPILPAALGEHSGIIGAACLAMENMENMENMEAMEAMETKEAMKTKQTR